MSRPSWTHVRRELSRWAAFAVLGVVLGLGVVWAADADDVVVDPQVAALHQQGFDLQRTGRTDAAIDAYKAALELAPNHVPTLYEIGWSWYVLSKWEQVVATWERVLALEPSHGDAQRYLPEARANLELVRKARAPSAGTMTAPESVPRKDGPAIRFAFGGDTMMGSPLSRSGLPPNDGAGLFTAYADLMKDADIAFVNLEGALADSGDSAKCGKPSSACYAFRTPVRYVKNLADVGVDVVSIANNHANDYGEAGRATTRAALDGAKIAFSGPLGHETILDQDGTKVGFLAFSTSPGQNDLRRIDLAAVAVQDLATRADLVVVSFHGGAEGSNAQHVTGETETFYSENRGNVRAFAHAVVDAGADLVIGHGPHVLRGSELYKERLIAYSLGNFVTYGGFNLSGPLGLTALLVADVLPDGRFAGGRFVSGRQISPGGPVIDDSHEAAKTIRALSRADLGAAAVDMDEDGTLRGVATAVVVDVAGEVAEGQVAAGSAEEGEEAGADEAGADEAGADEAGADEAGADEAGADEAGADEAGLDEAGADEAGAAQTGTADGEGPTSQEQAEPETEQGAELDDAPEQPAKKSKRSKKSRRSKKSKKSKTQ